MPKVTVIVPAYNAENYIERCAQSLLSQTLSDMELIFIDDGSTDRTRALLDALTAGRENVTVRSQENHGLYVTRSIGLALATGDYVGWVDADDYVEPDMFQTLYDTAVEHGSELVYCDYDWFPAKSSYKEKWFRAIRGKPDASFVERNSQPWNKLVSRALLERLNIGALFESCFDEAYIRVLLRARTPVAVDRALYHYRVSSSGMSGAYRNPAHYLRFVRASEALRDAVAPDIGDDAYWRDYFEYRIIYYRLLTVLVAANAGDRAAYRESRAALLAMRPRYWKNAFFHPILRENFGALKAFVIGGVVSACWPLARLACRFGFREGGQA